MKKINSWFTIGTIGIIITAILHILMTLLIRGNVLQITFLVVYPVFITFLVIGFRKILKEHENELI